MRAIAAVGLVLPLLAASWHYVALMPAFWVAWSLAGWGAFQSMGQSPVDMDNPVAAELDRLGLTNPTDNDMAGMAAEGMLVMQIIAGVLGITVFPHVLVLLALWASGVAFAPLYYLPQRLIAFPNLGRFAKAGSEWGEVLVGAWVMGLLVLTIHN